METQAMYGTNGSRGHGPIHGQRAEYVVTQDVQAAGAITYWRLASATTLADLSREWQAAGLDARLLPEAPSAKTALTRALRDQESATRKLVKAGGFWAIIDIKGDAAGHVVETVQRIKARAENDRLIIEAMDESPEAAQVLTAVHTAYVQQKAQLAGSDISVWLTSLAVKMMATSLRDSGGVYFLPQPVTVQWRQIAQTLAKLNHAVFTIPALRGDEAVAAIIDSITQEAENALRTLTAELAGETAQTPGKRALTTKASDCVALSNKVAMYADLLDADLAGLQAKIERMRQTVENQRVSIDRALDNADVALAAATLAAQ